MKAKFEHVAVEQGTHSFVAYELVVPRFEFAWHYHPEYELTYIVEGAGQRLVGDSFADFTAGDLVLLGPGLPHTWESRWVADVQAKAIVIQFSEDFIRPFLHLVEFRHLSEFLQASLLGLQITELPSSIEKALLGMPDAVPSARVLGLISVLSDLAAGGYVPLASAFYSPAKSSQAEDRLNAVCRFIQERLRANLSLEEVAAHVHLTASAFCTFFKRTTGKTFSDYVNDLRIGQVCQLLASTDGPIADIAFSTGFESLTYFNRVFLRKKGISPRVYRQLWAERAVGSGA